MAFIAQYFKQELLGNVRADVDVMIRRMAALDQDAEPSKRKRARITAAATDNDATDPLQLAKFPAHSIVLDTSEYFKVQQVREFVGRLA
jgi:hypothetical protein